MTLRSRHLTPIILAVFVIGIGGTMVFNLWSTVSSKEPAKFTTGELAGQNNPADIRGSYSLGDIAAAFPVPVEALARAFGVQQADPAAFQAKQLETIYAGMEGGEIGTDSVRWFVALYAGLPYTPEEDSLLPPGALGVLADRLSPERLEELKAHTVGLGAAPVEPTAPAPAGATHTEQTVAGEIKGKTTFGELTSWGVSREAIEAALGGLPMGKPGVSVRDYCVQNGIEFSTVKTALQAAADAALGKR